MLIAVSGGPDSTALLIALHDTGHKLVVAHYDHAMRPDSAADARHVAALCERLSVPLVTERRTVALRRGSLQAAARAARYAFLERARQAARADVIATAHTLDDHLETILMNLLRGAGLSGLAGIPQKRGFVARPLLTSSRDEVMAFLGARGIGYLRDASNEDRRFLRVAVRHDLIPALELADPKLRNRLARMATLAATATAHLDNHLPGTSREELQPASRLARARTLSCLFSSLTEDGLPLARRHLDALQPLIDEWRPGSGFDLPNNVRLTLTADAAVVTTNNRAPSRPPEPPLPELKAGPCPGCSAPNAVHLKPGRIEVGRRRPGLTLRPTGTPGTRRLQDVLVDAKVPAADRDRLPLVFRNGQLAWVPGVAVDVEHSVDRSKPGLHVEIRTLSSNGPADA